MSIPNHSDNTSVHGRTIPLGAMIAIAALVMLGAYALFGQRERFIIKPATGTAQAMAAASTDRNVDR